MAEIKKIIQRNRLAATVSCLSIIFFLSSAATILEEKRIDGLWEIRRGKEAGLEKLAELSIQYPDYRDLLYRLAVSQYELGNNEEAKDALLRAKYLDPNNETFNQAHRTLLIDLSLD